MGGGLDIPHWQAKNCTVGPHTPELQNIERRLAARGLKAGFVFVHPDCCKNSPIWSKMGLLPTIAIHENAHCSNADVRIGKNLQDKSKAAITTPMKRASKGTPK